VAGRFWPVQLDRWVRLFNYGETDMATKKELEQEIKDLRERLYAERQDFAHERQKERVRFSEFLREKSKVKQVLKKLKDGNLEGLVIIDIEQSNDGF
jgi:uncharacterized protein with PIN domain